MKDGMIKDIIVAAIGGIIAGLVLTFITGLALTFIPSLRWWTPTIHISSPTKDQNVEKILSNVSGYINGNIPDNGKVIVGHRETTETTVALHVDRIVNIHPDKSFTADAIYLGNDTQGINSTFEVIAVLVEDETAATLAPMALNPKGLTEFPKNFSKTITVVKRIK